MLHLVLYLSLFLSLSISVFICLGFYVSFSSSPFCLFLTVLFGATLLLTFFPSFWLSVFFICVYSPSICGFLQKSIRLVKKKTCTDAKIATTIRLWNYFCAGRVECKTTFSDGEKKTYER